MAFNFKPTQIFSLVVEQVMEILHVAVTEQVEQVVSHANATAKQVAQVIETVKAQQIKWLMILNLLCNYFVGHIYFLVFIRKYSFKNKVLFFWKF